MAYQTVLSLNSAASFLADRFKTHNLCGILLTFTVGPLRYTFLSKLLWNIHYNSG